MQIIIIMMPNKKTKYKKWKKRNTQFQKNDLWFDRDYGTVLGTRSWGMLQRQFPSYDWPGRFCIKIMLRARKLVAQHGAWSSAGLNSCVKKWGPQFIFNTCRILCTVLGNCSQYDTSLCVNPLRMHQPAHVIMVMTISILTKLLLTSFSVFLDYPLKHKIFSS